jgi:hypothetical protein
MRNTTHESASLEELLQEEALRSQQEYDRHSADERRATKRAARYLARANASEELAKRSRAKAAKALGVRDEFRFDALYFALRRDDPTTTRLPPPNIIDWKYPAGYGERLGKALQNNTRVSVLNVDLQNLVPALLDTQQSLSLIGTLLQYIRSSKSLRSFCIRTDRQPNREVEQRLVDEMVKAFFERRQLSS